MRCMMIVKGSENFAVSGPPPAALVEAIERLGEEAARKGTMVSFGGLELEIRQMYEAEDDVRAVQIDASRLLEHETTA